MYHFISTNWNFTHYNFTIICAFHFLFHQNENSNWYSELFRSVNLLCWFWFQTYSMTNICLLNLLSEAFDLMLWQENLLKCETPFGWNKECELTGHACCFMRYENSILTYKITLEQNILFYNFWNILFWIDFYKKLFLNHFIKSKIYLINKSFL